MNHITPIINVRIFFGHTALKKILERDLPNFSDIRRTRIFFSETGTTKHDSYDYHGETSPDRGPMEKISVPELGPVAAFELRVSSNTALIVFVISDVEWVPSFLESLVGDS